jgi:CRP-like cAMP-binding protein
MVDAAVLRENAILGQLPQAELAELDARSELVEMATRDAVYDEGGPIGNVYFPFAAVFSMVATTEEQVVVEVATIGREGMAGLPLFLGAATSPHACFCQVPGASLRLGADDLRRVLSRDGSLHRALSRFAQATMVQISQNVVCNNAHTAEQRAARWLLTTHDRVGRAEFPLTQQFLAQMLGLRRPTVSEIAQGLQARDLISYHRGQMVIEDRAGLEALTCDCYTVVRREFDAMMRGDVADPSA